VKRWLVALAFAFALGDAQAGRTCEAHPPTEVQMVQGLELAQRTAQALDASGARVVALARAGQDLSAYGLRWSHFGFAYFDERAQAWRVVHKLNRCGTATASLYRQGLAEFFMDDPWRYEAAFVVLSPAAQQALAPVLADDSRVAAMHEPAYNMVAYAWGTRYQQSNQWALETLAMAMAPRATDRERAQGWLKSEGYLPDILRLDAFTRLGAELTRANIAFDDHPPSQRFAGRISTVTVDSVFAFLRTAGLGGEPQVVR